MWKQTYNWLCLFLLLCIGVQSCEVINPADPVAVVFEIQPFELTTAVEQGSSSEKITEGWVYVNDEFLGSYSLPAQVPFIADGATSLVIFPGIRANGILTTPDIYPFYAEYELNFDVVPGERYEINPTTQYLESTKFSFIENFDGTNIFAIDKDGDPVTKLVIDSEVVLEGAGSGRMTVSRENNDLEVFTIVKFSDIKLDGRPVYIELDYKNDAPFTMGLVGSEGQGEGFPNYFYIFKEKEDWNKIYIDISEQIRVSGFENYQLAFQVLYPPNSEMENHKVYLDNIKLLHF